MVIRKIDVETRTQEMIKQLRDASDTINHH